LSDRQPHTPQKTPSPTPQKSARKQISLRKADEYLRFVVFLAVIGFIYIANAHYAEEQVAQSDKLKQERKALKSEYFLRKSELSANVRYTEMIHNIDSLGLHKPEKAPFKLIKKKKNR
jgi:hypothetical protein